MLSKLSVLLCAAVLASASDLPDRKVTPGSTVKVPIEVLCEKGYTKSVRHVSGSVKAAVYREYGIESHQSGGYEVDHLISLELGGSNEIENVWPQPYEGVWNAHVKDQLEDRLHAMVCSGQIGLKEAQKGISEDWITEYKKVFNTGGPIAFRETSRRRRR
jgi:hypothetical protein